MTWTWWALPGIIGGWVSWAGAVVLLRTGPHSPVNRRLAAVLLVEGAWMHGTLFFMIGNEGAFLLVAKISVAALCAIPFQYLAFLGASLDTPLVKPFRSGTAWAVLSLASLAAAISVFLVPDRYIGELYTPSWAALNFYLAPLGQLAIQAQAAASLIGLVVSLHAFVRAPRGTVSRARAKWFVFAFGVRDLFNVSWWTLYPVYRDIPFWGDFLSNIAPMVIAFLYIAILTYAVLRVQLFDIDLKLKFVLRQGTVGAVIAGGFFVGSEWLESVVPVEGTILGLAVAGLVVVLLRPLQGFAEAFATRIMSGVQDTEAYRSGRRQEVYRAAYEGAAADGELTDREREILAHVQTKLGISADKAQQLEQEVASLLNPV